MVTPTQLFKDISNGKFKPAYYFYGTEDYRITEAEKFLTRQFLPGMQMTINYRKFDGRKTKAGDLITHLSNLPMLGEKQVFVVTDFQSYKPKEITHILSLLIPPDPNRIIIFSSPSLKTPKKSSVFFTSVSKEVEPVEFNKLTFNEVVAQIRLKLQKAKINISNDALKLLTELISGNRGALEVELNKLVDYKLENETIEVEDIKKISTGFEVFKIFDLADLVVAGNSKKVLQMVNLMLAEGNSPSTFTTLLQQHFISLYLVKNGKSLLGNRNWPALVQKMKTQAGKYSNDRLEDIIIKIAEVESDLRHGGIQPNTILQMLAMTLSGENKKTVYG